MLNVKGGRSHLTGEKVASRGSGRIYQCKSARFIERVFRSGFGKLMNDLSNGFAVIFRLIFVNVFLSVSVCHVIGQLIQNAQDMFVGENLNCKLFWNCCSVIWSCLSNPSNDVGKIYPHKNNCL